MKNNKIKYFNFPITLLTDFLIKDKEVLNNIYSYAIYNHAVNFPYGNVFQIKTSIENFFGISLGDVSEPLKNGKKLFDNTPTKTPKVGISTAIFFEFYETDKTEYEKVCLLGFLAIKSIVQNKPYCKVTNKFWLSRMAGKGATLDILPDWLKKYNNEYQIKKIKDELKNSWGLVTYSRYTRGFYVSFTLNLDALVFEAEKRRKSTKDKQYKILENDAIQKAYLRLNTTRP